MHRTRSARAGADNIGRRRRENRGHGCVVTMRIYLRAVAYFRSDWPLIATSLLLTACGTAIGLLMAWPMAILVDTVLAPDHKHHTDFAHRLFLAPLPDGRLAQVIGLAVAGLLLKLVADLLGVAQAVVQSQINYSGLLRVRCDLYRKLQALNLAYHRAQPQGDAIYRLNSDTLGCQTILWVLVGTFVSAVTLVVMTSILASRNVTLTLLAFSIVPVLAIANIVYGQRLKQRTLDCKEVDTRFTTVIQRSMNSIFLVQAFGREEAEFGTFHGTIRDTIRAWWRLNRQQWAYNLIVGTTFGVGGAIIFGYGGYLVYRDQFGATPRAGGMTVGDLMIFSSYLGMLWGPLCALTGFSANIAGGVAGAQRVFEVLDRNAVIVDDPAALPLPRQPRTLELDNVSFAYDANKLVLRGVSATIRPGEMVAFVGSSGVGKSTVLNLLPRFYDPTLGAIRLDGIDVRTCRVGDVRRHVALVLQESVILPTTIAENIAYGRTGATREQIVEAATLSGAAEFIDQLPKGYDTEIVDGGQNLSGGQRQRISIARALLTEAPFVVLDEPTSALDPHHEQVVIDALRSLKRTRTIVLVSHRLSSVVDCDQIFVMDRGRVVEHGTHAELLGVRGLYHAMWSRQMHVPITPPAEPTPAVMHKAA
jgi:ABC-type multidrug transport system fused ATPase/permease subunit